jgi:Fe-S-cluster containining protein
MKLDVLPSTDPWYADGLKFTCTQCGNCCTGPPGYVWISREEIVRLAEFLRMSLEETIERFIRIVGDRFALLERINLKGEYDCAFLRDGDGKKQCSVYAARPLQCRTWPFWPGTLASKEMWDTAAVRCHGMNKGRHFSADEIAARRDAEDWPAENSSTT